MIAFSNPRVGLYINVLNVTLVSTQCLNAGLVWDPDSVAQGVHGLCNKQVVWILMKETGKMEGRM